MTQYAVPCSVYRGGTSRGLFFKKEDLPKSEAERRHIFLSGIDAYNLSQVNGLGSGTSHTSKVIVVEKSSRPDACFDYTFYQIGIGQEVVDAEGTCGNLMAGVGAFAVNEGYVEIDPGQQEVTVFAFNKNINKMIQMTVPVQNGQARATGTYLMPGLVHPGARFEVGILSPGGGKTGTLFPIGQKSVIETETRNYDITFADLVNPFVFVRAADVGLPSAKALMGDLSGNDELLHELEEIRLASAIKAGMAKTLDEAKAMPAIPKIALIAPPSDYRKASGHEVRQEDVHIVAKMVSMQRFHRTFAGSGLYNLAGTTLLEGTIPEELCRANEKEGKQIIRIGHPDGIAEVTVSLNENRTDIEMVGLERTARLIMKGELFVPLR